MGSAAVECAAENFIAGSEVQEAEPEGVNASTVITKDVFFPKRAKIVEATRSRLRMSGEARL